MKACWLMLLLLSCGPLRADTAGLLQRAEHAVRAGRWEEARNTLGRAAAVAQTPEEREEALTQLGALNLSFLLSPREQPETVWVQVQAGDTLGKIARRAGTTIELLTAMNRLSEKGTVRLGRRLKVPIEPFTVQIHVRENVATLMLGGRFFKQYSVSTGARGNTPTGTFQITDRIMHPDWWHPQEKRMIPYGDPEHRIGSHWLGWTVKGFGMHGTDEPEKIGQPVSLGCVRFRNEEIAEVFMLLPTGTEVTVKP